jgi:biotin carboxyl carrier protein
MIKKFKVWVDGKEYYVEVEGVEEEKTTEKITINESIQEKRAGVKDKEEQVNSASLATTGKCIKAPMPGAVVKINCRQGEMVRKGDVLIILEAMKMENEIHSPIDGFIKEICVKEGMTVSSEEVMAIFE